MNSGFVEHGVRVQSVSLKEGKLRSTDDVVFDDRIDDDSETTGIPQEERQLFTQAYDKAVSDLVSMIGDGDIWLDPDYQRNYVWDDVKASLLIESILLNVPIPVIYVAEEDAGEWSVVDGLQRLHSLKRFFDNDFKLKRLDVLQELNGLSYSKLNSKASRLLRNGIIRVIMITKESHPEIKYDIFMRLNRGAQRLTEQELRNCLYRGKFNQLLHDLRADKVFLGILRRDEPDKRMADGEMILRYLMVSEGFDRASKTVTNYTGNMKSSLNRFMEQHQNAPSSEISRFRGKFEQSLAKVHAVFGEESFRKPLGESFDERPNRAIMESQMVALDNYPIDEVKARRDRLLAAFKAVSAKPEFDDAVTIRTSNKSQLHTRVGMLWEAFHAALNGG